MNSIKTLIVFGFNFNPYDMAVLNLLKNNSRTISKIIIVDIESKLTQARKVWPNKPIKEIHADSILLTNLVTMGDLFED